MTLQNKISIVVPCKNEEQYIYRLLDDLRFQGLGGAKIIIADCSTDRTREVIQEHSAGLNIEIIEGGTVSVARNRAAQLVTTPYILFIDADVRFFTHHTIQDAVDELERHDLDIVGLNAKCYDGDVRAQIGFKIFNSINHILKHFSPFAVGAFMLTRKDRFDQYGGFSEEITVGEDFHLSKKYNAKKFRIVKHYFGQDSRRFKKMGYFGMSWLMFKNIIYVNSPEKIARENHKKYWL